MANKKINQLVSKTAILSTDIFGIGDATTGQLFKKTIAELQAAIGGAVISVNGLVGTVVLDTDDIQELATPTNKYFTDARARGAISLTVTGNSGASTYSSGTGVLNVPTYTLAGLGGITATFLSGTSGISYNSGTGVISYSGTVYTDASIRALFSGGTGITYNSSTGAISYSGTVYTDSSVRALISITTTGTSGASTYNNTTGVINVPNYTLAGLGGISYTSLSGGTGITYNNTTGAISYSGTVYTDASVRALISASGAVSYNNTTGVISLTSGNLTEATSSVLTITGGTGAVLGSGTSIQVKQASSSVSGFLSSTDWNTFNGKASALSGTTNYVAKFTSSSAIGNSLIFDNGTNVGIGNTSPVSLFNLYGDTTLLQLQNSTTGTTSGDGTRITLSGSDLQIINRETANIILYTTDTERMRINANGNFDYGGINISAASPNTTYKQAFYGGLSLLWRGGEDAYLNSNHSYTSTNTNTASYNSSSGIGRLSIGGGNFEWGTYNGSVTAGTAYSLTSRFLISSAGNVGIGTTTPAYKLDVSANIRIFTSSLTTSGTIGELGFGPTGYTRNTSSISSTFEGTYWYNGSNLIFKTHPGPDITDNPSSERMRITKDGLIGVGTSAPSYKFNTLGTSDIVAGFGRSDYNAGNVMLVAFSGFKDNYKLAIGTIRTGDYDVGHMIFCVNGSANGVNVSYTDEAMRITTSKNILMGTTSDNGERLYVSGAIRATSTITANSDITLKKNLLRIENALEKVEQINGYTYEFKEDDSKRHAGVIAQEIQTVLPEIVNKGNDGILGVEYGNISALLIEAIKEQNIKIKNLETLLASK